MLGASKQRSLLALWNPNASYSNPLTMEANARNEEGSSDKGKRPVGRPQGTRNPENHKAGGKRKNSGRPLGGSKPLSISSRNRLKPQRLDNLDKEISTSMEIPDDDMADLVEVSAPLVDEEFSGQGAEREVPEENAESEVPTPLAMVDTDHDEVVAIVMGNGEGPPATVTESEDDSDFFPEQSPEPLQKRRRTNLLNEIIPASPPFDENSLDQRHASQEESGSRQCQSLTEAVSNLPEEIGNDN
ncbi:hypothetical protein HDU67_001518, partial [Dinochytrium kinnereticum]